jgi:predicted helicase
MLEKYLKDIQNTKSRNGSEYSYRSDLRQLFKGLTFTDEPTGKGKNKIDMEVYTPQGLVSFYIETKDIKEDITHKKHQTQFAKYKLAYPKLIITNFLDFEFYKDNVLVGKCSLADNKAFTPDTKAFDTFNTLLDSFMLDHVKFDNPSTLAKKLADNTKLLKAEILNTLIKDDAEIEDETSKGITSKKNRKLIAYRNEFKKMLLEEIDNNQFADLYAQTLTYGLFASRYYLFQKDPNAIFTRKDASDLIPDTNPLLKQFFDSISRDTKSSDLGKSINTIIDNITTILANADISQIIAKLKLANNDIVIHFYETFLEHYDPELRKQMGVWYTPVEVVDYIVKGVDEILKSKFGIVDGIASSEKQSYTFNKKVKVGEGSYKTEVITKENVHKVQILDPATGTGNFLNSVVSYIKNSFPHKSLWKSYVNDDLIPRLNGFELMMPSYVMAHMKMYELLRDSLNEHSSRFNIYLTNTLNGGVEIEEANVLTVSDLIEKLHEEALGANRVRQEQPVMVVLGNPPYNGRSKNNGKFISDLMSEYAMKSSNGALNDDYIKFIRYAQNLVDQNGSGVVAYISNNSFLSSVAMTNVRKSLLKSFDEIYILNFTFDEKDPYEKVKDRIFETVKTPVCIYFFVKTGLKAKGGLGDVYYKEFQGAKSDKFKYLETGSVNKQDFKQINLLEPEYYFYPLDEDVKKEYVDKSFSLNECFKDKGTGVLTACDSLVLDTRQARLETKISAYFTKGELSGASDKVNDRKTKHRVTKKEDGNFTSLPYRPFDTKAYFDSDLTEGRREEIRKHEKADNQVFLAFKASCHDNNNFSHVLITKKVGEYNYFHNSTKYAPLYQYREATPLSPASQTSNFTTDFLNKFGKAISKSHQDDPTLATDQTFSSLDVLDYIYGVLNDKAYTTKYNQFLKSNYPRVKFPDSIDSFISYKEIGSKLRLIHLDDSSQDTQATYNATNNTIEKVSFSNNKLFFNKSDFFDNISQDMYDFKIGASQPLKNWLEARKGDSFDKPMLEQFMNVIYKVRLSLH